MSSELDHLRTFRAADDAPDPAARAAARAALLERIEADAAASPARRPLALRLPRRRLLAGGLGLAGAATAIVVAVLAGLGGGAVQPAPASAAETLRRVAVVAERAPDVVLKPGQYWYVRSEQAGAGAGDAAFVREDWRSIDGSGRVVQRGAEPVDVTIHGDDPKARGELYGGFPEPFTYEQLRALPVATDALYERLEQLAERWAGEHGAHVALESRMFAIVGSWLRAAPPAPAKLRAALYRVAAQIPGVELMGERPDASGRPGVAVALTEEGSRRELVFDPRTTELIAERSVRVSTGELRWEALYVGSGVVGSTRERP
jgi:hypothetical protein